MTESLFLTINDFQLLGYVSRYRQPKLDLIQWSRSLFDQIHTTPNAPALVAWQKLSIDSAIHFSGLDNGEAKFAFIDQYILRLIHGPHRPNGTSKKSLIASHRGWILNRSLGQMAYLTRAHEQKKTPDHVTYTIPDDLPKIIEDLVFWKNHTKKGSLNQIRTLNDFALLVEKLRERNAAIAVSQKTPSEEPRP